MFLFTYTSAILSIFCFFIAGYIYIKKRNDTLSNYFAWYVFFVAIWTGSNSLADIAITEQSYRFWSGVIIFGATFFIASFMSYIEYFTTEIKLSSKKYAIFYIPAIVISCFGFTKFFIDEVYISYSTPTENSMGLFVYIMLIYAISGLFYAFVRLLKNILHTSHQKRQQGIYVITGFILLIMTGAIFSLILPILGNYKYYSAGPQTVFIMIILTAYATYKYKLLNIKLIIQKSIVYIILSSIFIGLYIFIISLMSFVLSTIGIHMQPIAIAVAAILGAIGVPPIKKYLQIKTDKIFFKDHKPYADAMDILDSVMNLNLDLKSLMKDTMIALNEIFKPQNISIFLTREQILYTLKNNNDIEISSEHNFELLPPYNDSLFFNAEHNGVILAQILIGEKKSGDVYLPEDRQIITSFSYRFAMALEKTYLYEKVKKGK